MLGWTRFDLRLRHFCVCVFIIPTRQKKNYNQVIQNSIVAVRNIPSFIIPIYSAKDNWYRTNKHLHGVTLIKHYYNYINICVCMVSPYLGIIFNIAPNWNLVLCLLSISLLVSSRELLKKFTEYKGVLASVFTWEMKNKFLLYGYIIKYAGEFTKLTEKKKWPRIPLYLVHMYVG